MSLIDHAALDRTNREDPGLIADLLDIFCAQLPALLERFDRAIESRNCAEVRESAHLMKSRLRYLHCCRLGDLAARIESLSKEGELEEIESKVAILKSGIVDAVEELRRYVGEAAT